MALSTLGTDPDYSSLLAQRNDPRLLMAQKLMDVEKMPTNNSTQSSFWANLLNQGARGALGGYLYNDVQADREKERVKQEDEAKAFRERMEGGPPGGTGTAQPNGSLGAAQPSVSPAPAQSPGASAQGDSDGVSLQGRLRQRESSGDYTIMNKQRYAGGYQFGSDLLAANKMYQPTEQGEPANTWGGTFSIPGHPNVKTLADFRNTPAAQDTAYRIAMANNDKQLRDMGVYDRAAKLGSVGGVPITRDGLLAGAWLGGVHGVAEWVDNGGHSKAHDANGTRIGDYVRLGAGGGQGAPATAKAPTMARGGQQADASPPPGSNMEAMLSGMDAPKPRNMQLAERVALGGGGNTATDSPTPILSAPVVPVASAALQGVAGPQPPSADVPQPSPIEPIGRPPASVPAPPSATVPQPEPAVVPPPLANMDPATLAKFNGVPQPEPAVVPQPEPAVVPQPEPAVVPPPDQAAVPPPDAATVPAAQPSVETAPAGSGETGGQPTVLPQEEPPLPVPPVPPRPSGSVGPGLLAQRLGGGGDNATEALNTASLAAARKGENFVPGAPTQRLGGAGPSGQQLAAPLMSWAGNLGADGAPLLTPAAGPTGPQLAAPLVTPTSGPSGAGAGATGGQSKAPQAPAPAPQADAQAQADWYLSMAREAAGSSNPKIRAQAGVLEAQGQALQRRIDRQDVLDQQLGARRDAASERAADRDAAREAAAANRNSETKDVLVGNDVHIFERDRSSGTWKDTGLLSGNQRTQPDKNVQTQNVLDQKDGKVHVYERDPSSGTWKDTGLLHDKQPGEGGGAYSGKSVPAEDRNILDRLHDKIVKGTASEEEKRQYSRSYNSLQNGDDYNAPDPLHPGQDIRVPGHPTDLTGYAPPPYRDTTPKPGKAPTEGERKDAGYARRMDLANEEIDKLGSRSFGDVLAGRVPVVGNYLISDQGQQFRTAADAWIMAKLRPESGAVIGEHELQQNFEIYFPMPGDSPARVALKKRLRDLETENSRRTAGNAYTPPSGGGGPVRITDDDAGRKALQSLKPGDPYVGPDGKAYRKN